MDWAKGVGYNDWSLTAKNCSLVEKGILYNQVIILQQQKNHIHRKSEYRCPSNGCCNGTLGGVDQ